MNLPYQLGNPLPEEVWRTVKRRTILEHCKWDIQSEDHCVLAEFPLLLSRSSWEQICGIAEALSRELASAEHELLSRVDLQARLGLPRALREEFQRLANPAEGVARVIRFDFHFTEEGWRISEANADVPGGFIEASGFTRLVAAFYPGTATPPDPAAIYAQQLAGRLGREAVVALVHATAYSDDRQVMQYLANRIAEHGMKGILVSPAHIRWDHARAWVRSSFAVSPLDAIVRFFPAEWLPTLRERSQWAWFLAGSQTPISNPASAALVQSKRFPLVWNDLSTDLCTWRSMLPETRCPSTVLHELEKWVAKPALGRVGEDIGMPGVSSDGELKQIHRAARQNPSEWVAQRRFTVVPLTDGSRTYYPSIGVFTIDGIVAGAYARVGNKPLIDHEAQDIAVLISSSGGQA